MPIFSPPPAVKRVTCPLSRTNTSSLSKCFCIVFKLGISSSSISFSTATLQLSKSMTGAYPGSLYSFTSISIRIPSFLSVCYPRQTSITFTVSVSRSLGMIMLFPKLSVWAASTVSQSAPTVFTPFIKASLISYAPYSFLLELQ